MRLSLFIILLPLLFPVSSSALGCDDVQKLLLEVVQLRDLAPKRAVVCEMLDRRGFEEVKERQFSKTNMAAQMKREETAYKLLGLIPADYEYEDCMAQFSKGDVLPFYSVLERKIVLPQWKDNAADVIVHELVHALQDQNYDLQSFGYGRPMSLDSYLATSALIEGDATLLQERFNKEHGRDESLLQGQEVQSEIRDKCRLPGALIDLYDFPYGFGRIFVERLMQSAAGKRSADLAFRHPPLTTREVLHRSAYDPAQKIFFKSQIPALPLNLAVSENARLVFAEVLGQYATRLVLRDLPNEQAILAAKGWYGDRVGLYEGKNPAEKILLWRSVWESEKEAQEFFQALKAMFGRKLEIAFDANAPELRYFSESHGNLYLKKNKSEVFVIVFQ